MVKKEKPHIHTYERSRYTKDVYRCIHPRCRHYDRRLHLVGKVALCNKCQDIFVLSLHQLRNRSPVCDYCSKSPKAETLRKQRENALDAALAIFNNNEDEENNEQIELLGEL